MSLLDDPDFRASHVFAELQAAPLGFVDVGARGGVLSFADAIEPLAAVLAFEPDPAAIAQLKNSLSKRWRCAEVESAAVGGCRGKAELNLFAHGVNHSLLKVNRSFRDRYSVGSLAEKGTIPVELETIDAVLFERRQDQPFWGELIKLDAQGAELHILKGAPRTLAERTVAIISEVCFLEIYAEQPRFSHLEQFLADAGFTFYGFFETQGWSQKFIDKREVLGRERACHADAVFLKDPLPSGKAKGPISRRQYDMLYLCALLLKYYDFAVELAAEGDFDAEEAERLIRLAQRQGRRTAKETIGEIEALLEAMKTDPAQANLNLMRFVGKWRHFADIADAALPRRTPVPRARR
jgi:FkbM family methyltransferase